MNMFLFINKKNTIGLLLCLLTISVGIRAQQADNKIASTTNKVSFLVKGKVIDASTGKGINGAELFCGTFGSAITTETGEFEIKVPSTSSRLTVKSEGFQGKEIALKGRMELNIYLTSNRFISLYKEKNVSSGDKADLGFPFALSQTNNNSQSTTSSIAEQVQSGIGEVRSISRSGTALIGGNMFIRGFNTINSNSQPLIVVDGIPYEELLERQSINAGYFNSALENINLDDVEKISVIKDGYSFYGVKGANGVIAITTKRATEMKSKIEASMSAGITTTPKQIPMMQAADFRTYASEQIGGAQFTPTQISDLQYLNDDPAKIYYHTFHNNTNWQDQVYRNAVTQNYHFQITGGDEVAKYGLFLGYVGGEGLLKSTDFNRLTTRFNADVDVVKNLTLTLGLAYNRTQRNLRDDGMGSNYSPGTVALTKSPLVSPYLLDANGNPLSALADNDVFGVSNPMSIIDNGTGLVEQSRLSGYVKMLYDVSKSLSLKASFSYNLDKLKESATTPSFGAAPVLLTDGTTFSNTIKARNMQYIGIYTDFSANYKREFAYAHHLNAVAGVRYETNHSEDVLGVGHNSADDKFIFLTNSLSGRAIYGGYNEWKWLSAYSTVDYDYLKKYFLSVNASADGSSRTGINQKYGVFPSVGAGWLVNSEKFMADAKWIDLLKIRASYGLTGNDNVGNYNSRMYFGATNYLDKIGLMISHLKNEDLKWETTEKKNVGLDLSLFNERISLSADVYRNNTRDLLTYQTLSQMAGITSAFMNGGNLQNQGVELALGLRLIDTKNFKWSTRFNITKNENKITSLPVEVIYNGVVVSRVGQAIGSFFGYKALGVFATENEAASASKTGGYLTTKLADGSYQEFHAGDMKFEDVDGNGIINDDDRQIIGNPNPKLYGSFGTNFIYKSWSLNVDFSYCYGNDVYNYQRSQLESMAGFSNQTQAVLNRWKSEGQVTNIPRASYGDPVGNARFSNRWIEDGSFVKLKNVTISWTSPKRLLFMDGLTVFATGSNLLVLTKYLGSDPEFSASNSSMLQGIDLGLMPQSRSFIAGIKINL
jgi:TonB-linked SusC/RagA family outer membrane protein